MKGIKLEDVGLSSVQLTSEAVEDDPSIWTKMDNGAYRVVYATPEVLLQPRSHFLKNTVRKNTVFKQQLCLIAMDEAHTLHAYREFRRSFSQIGKLRAIFPDVPYVGLSATMAPPVANYVRKHSNMRNPAKLITVTGRRDNIDIAVLEQHGKDNLDQLLELIPSDASAVRNIPQTLIFVDMVDAAKVIALALRSRLPQSGAIKPSVVIRTYYSSIDDPKKDRTQRLVLSGRARIVVCTDAMSMGVDFPNIERVIQWGVDAKVNLPMMTQRIGRAARNENKQGIAIIYVSWDVVKLAIGDWREAWVTDAARDLLDGVLPVKDAIPRGLLSLPVLPETLPKVDKLRDHLWRKAEIDAEAKGSPKGIEDPLLWFLCNAGCRHECLMMYFGYDDDVEGFDQKSWCCDNCAINKGDYTGLSTAGFSPASSIRLQESSNKPKPVQPRVKLLPAQVTQCQEQLEKNIKEWRNILFKKLLSRDIVCEDMLPEVVLPTKTIEAIVNSVRKIASIDWLRYVLHSAHFRPEESLLRTKDVEELYAIVCITIRESGTPIVIVLRTISCATPGN